MLPLELLLVSDQAITAQRQIRSPLARNLSHIRAGSPRPVRVRYAATHASVQSSSPASEPLSFSTAEIAEIYAATRHSRPRGSLSGRWRSSELTRTTDPVALAHDAPWLQVDPEDPSLPQELSEVLVSQSHTVSPSRLRWDWRQRALSKKLQAPGTTTSPSSSLSTPRTIRHPIRIKPPASRLHPADSFFSETSAYEERFLPLLTAEEAEENAVVNERLASWGLDRLRDEGYCLTGLSAYWLNATQFGRPVASFSAGPGVELPEHKFDNGTTVLLSRLDPLQEKPSRGSVVSRTPTQLHVAFEERLDIEEGVWRLDIGRSNIIFDRMRDAISNLQLDPSQQLERPNLSPFISTPPPSFFEGTSRRRETILQGTYLRDILLRSFSPAPGVHHDPQPLQDPDDVAYPPHGHLRVDDVPIAAELGTEVVDENALNHPSHTAVSHAQSAMQLRGAFVEDQLIQSWARRYMRPNPVRIEGDPVLPLNESQTRAVAMMVGERVSLVQGPPGTGKTKTIIEAVKLLKRHFAVPHPILVCTFTNVAVDNLVEGLAPSLSPLRVGYGGKVKPSLYPHTLDAKLEQHELYSEVLKLERQEEALEKRVVSLRMSSTKAAEKLSIMPLDAEHDRKRANATKRRDRLDQEVTQCGTSLGNIRKRIYAFKQQMLSDVVHAADVVCTTCITSACTALNVIDFPVVFLDEASMSTEPASLIPLMKGSQHMTLIGDHKQLPPVITSREAIAGGLGISLFERLTEEGVVPSIMLDLQYRMHPQISKFPSAEFYNFALRDGMLDSSGGVPAQLRPPTSAHLQMNPQTGDRPSVIFLDHQGLESPKDRSKVNYTDADIVCSVIEDLLIQNPDLRGEDIGVIAPYVAQIRLLTRLLTTDAKSQARFQAALGDQRAMQLPQIDIKTVDGFEGREKDVIIFSTVRSNSSGHVGFLADRRRLNVGLTRAKRGLFVVGNLNTLKTGRVGGVDGMNDPKTRRSKGAEAWQRYAEYLQEGGLVVRLTGERLRRTLYGSLGGVTVADPRKLTN
ncbi:P-loop containing nucleoside triphosphate hydrolase protein [Punctularia strigosozonata HHB-11173 SS5]|uniref:P-loop containing nucleoside triphosphate hydrolase protein n=1 Tax=Punctularia strigosozonata (strain HHB-11173) TaxID=741275 RepID=UPI0004416745|nr:P-loop containing nucleoside triphosphate hydrolase protein [Punctularia strigosozonata HHB-11173 SS5]EIN05865.1 P-loop containing nucleoside triphosphate hydrolase protein [Punctularia strigosozonata HHB-11173 SS5]